MQWSRILRPLLAPATAIPGRLSVLPSSLSLSSKRLTHSAAATVPRLDTFARRHIGTTEAERKAMMSVIGVDSVETLISQVVPASLRMRGPLNLAPAKTESEMLEHIQSLADMNEINRTFIGTGYYGTVTPPVIVRNILENPMWYTPYTPYQAEISQGRLQSLLNFQTMVSDLTGMEVANASLLDEATAAAEAVNMCYAVGKKKVARFFVSELAHPQTIAVLKSRTHGLGIELIVGDHRSFDFAATPVCGALVQYPATDGSVFEYDDFVKRAHSSNAMVAVASDLLALTQLRPPSEFGADIVLGSAQRFGVPLGYGGPHAAFFGTRKDLVRMMPGRIIGVTKDSRGKNALRLMLQPREQHIKREKATSNICTAQALLSNIAVMYAIYHGPAGLRDIAQRTNYLTRVLQHCLTEAGFPHVSGATVFDTITVAVPREGSDSVLQRALRDHRINLRRFDDTHVSISFDEKSSIDDVRDLVALFVGGGQQRASAMVDAAVAAVPSADAAYGAHARQTPFLTHDVFNAYHTEHEMLRYIHMLQSRDYGLQDGMIPLGSCTMKLNATAEMMPLSFPKFAHIHPHVPLDQARGYHALFADLQSMLAEITGFDAVSLQPNSGASGEHAGLLVIRKYHESRGEGNRNVCLIPVSAHGTNPASAAMAGFKVVTVKCDPNGNIDVSDLEKKADQYRDTLAAVMMTYPSTHGVFETSLKQCADIVHRNGGQVYMDGANMNAQIGNMQPGKNDMDVCHLNLHKTFCIPHGGGGPGMGPICVKSHLAPHLPDGIDAQGGHSDASVGSVAASRWGSASILTITYMFIGMMGGDGIRMAGSNAILNANYMAQRLRDHIPILYTGENGRVAHEFILDFRQVFKTGHVGVLDVAKRLMDYGFHAPTMSFPVAGTLMVEPTESESKAEMDRLCDALISIVGEIKDVEEGRVDATNNVLTNAPHTLDTLLKDNWDHPYSRELAAFPSSATRLHKVWPFVGRVDDTYGDKNIMCSCPPLSEYSS